LEDICHSQQSKEPTGTEACQASGELPARLLLPGEGHFSLNLLQGTGQNTRAAPTAWGSSDANTKICINYEPTDYGQEVTDAWSRSQAEQGL